MVTDTMQKCHDDSVVLAARTLSEISEKDKAFFSLFLSL